MLNVAKYEIKRYFVSSIGYVFIGAFFALSALLFYFFNISYQSSDVIGLYADMTSFLMILIPVLTMRSFAEEKHGRSEQFLLTAPISASSIVSGKFLAAATVYLTAMLLMAPELVIIGVYGRIYWGEVLVGFVGFLLLSCIYIASGLLVSSLCENQVSAAIMTFVVHFAFSALEWVIDAVSAGPIKEILRMISLYSRFNDVQRGILSLRFVVFSITATAVFLYATVVVLKVRRWKRT